MGDYFLIVRIFQDCEKILKTNRKFTQTSTIKMQMLGHTYDKKKFQLELKCCQIKAVLIKD